MSGRPQSAEEALELFLANRAQGDTTDAASFAARHPELRPELDSALQALLALESATRGPQDEKLPQRIGAFRIVRQVGRGGMGVVLEAIEEPLGRRVALKLIPSELLASSSARARFRREAELASRLDHPGIATVFGTGVDADRPWIAMRYVEGRSLAQSIVAAREQGDPCVRLPGAGTGTRAQVLELAACIARVARALQTAHEQGIVHRDVKPSNIVVAPDGTPVLLDFGLAIAEELDGQALTRTGETAGTPAYLAPELVAGERTRHDEACDVYSLGVTLHECLVLRRPFDAATPAALYRAILSSATPDLRAMQRAVTRDLAVVAATAMERDRSRRYRSAAAFAQDLEACVAGRPIAARPVPLSGRILRWARREPRQAVLGGLLALATIAAAMLAGTWWQSRSEVRAAARLTLLERYERNLQNGFSCLAANWNEEAEQEFLRALAIVPGDPEAIAGRALVRLKRRRDDEALQLLADAPGTPAFAALRALVQGRLPEAEQSAEWFASASAVELFVDGMRLSNQYERSSRSERKHLAQLAHQRFEDAILRSRTTRMLYHVQRALAASRARDAAAARSAAASLVVLWPDQERTLFTAGNALLDLDPAAAIPLLQRAIELDPKWEAPYQNLGNALMYTGQHAEAERVLRQALVLDPGDADALNSLGMVLEELGCADEARGAYGQALVARPMFETLANLAVLEASCGEPDRAEILLRFALLYDPRENLLRLPLAQLLQRRGSAPQALAEVEAVVGFDPGNREAWELLETLQLELGEREAAAAAGEIARELGSGR